MNHCFLVPGLSFKLLLIYRQLPNEARLFAQVDKSWKDIMRRTIDKPNAIRAATAAGNEAFLSAHPYTIRIFLVVVVNFPPLLVSCIPGSNPLLSWFPPLLAWDQAAYWGIVPVRLRSRILFLPIPHFCRFSLSCNQKIILKPFNYKNYEFQI